MEQRTYQGNLAPEAIADYLVQHYSAEPGLRAQKIGKEESFLVQVGHGDSHAVTVAIARAPGETGGLVVTMGQRHWITPHEIGDVAFWGLLAVLITPWVLFALLWPFSEIISNSRLPDDIWMNIELYVGGQGGAITQTQTLSHPHLGL